MTALTQDQKATNHDTFRHIERVRYYINQTVRELLTRGELHDQTKLEHPEVSYFTEYTPKLKGVTYGTPEYQELLDAIKPALDHHYANNRHHPEFHPDGINSMTLIDMQEMLCDWKAASERHSDGDIHKSIDHNAKRFGISPQLTQILHNTATSMFGTTPCLTSSVQSTN